MRSQTLKPSFFLLFVFQGKTILCSREFILELTHHLKLVAEIVVGRSGGIVMVTEETGWDASLINKSRFLKERGRFFTTKDMICSSLHQDESGYTQHAGGGCPCNNLRLIPLCLNTLAHPCGVALSPDEKNIYVGARFFRAKNIKQLVSFLRDTTIYTPIDEIS